MHCEIKNIVMVWIEDRTKLSPEKDLSIYKTQRQFQGDVLFKFTK